MKEYYENKSTRIICVFISFLLCLLSIWIILSLESAFVIVGGVAMLGLGLYTLVNSFVHKILLTENFIIEKSLFQTKEIFFNDITHLHVQSFFTEIIADKKKISIGKFGMQKSEEIIGTVVSKIKDNETLLVAGDPILFQAYVNEFSENESLKEYNEHHLTEFIFVESAELVKKQWLFREVNLKTLRGSFKITYFGKGMGYECVFVNEELVSKKDSTFWYVPNFDFNYHDINFSVNVRVYPWLTIRKFWIEVNNTTVYSE